MYESSEQRFGRTVGTYELLRITKDIADRANRALLVAEFGSVETAGAEKAKQLFFTELDALERCDVQFAALWVYDFDDMDDTFNVTATNSRSYQLQAIMEANERNRKKHANDVVAGGQ